MENLLWLKHEPGTFISTQSKAGKIIYWNVSKKSYANILKISDAGLLYCILLADPSKMLVSLANGSILIYDLKNKKKVFELQPGHSETIFDLKYNPFQYGILATCSYDANIKIWDMTKNQIIANMQGPESRKLDMKSSQRHNYTIYCLKWSIKEKDLILTGDAISNLRLWDTSKQKLIASVKVSQKDDASIVGLDWDEDDNVITGTSEGLVLHYKLITKSKFELTTSFKVPGVKVLQLKFNPFNRLHFAAAFGDGKIRLGVIETASTSDKKFSGELAGHQKKVFGLSFNPKRRNILASSSDDFSIGVWDLNTNNKFFLKGHVNNSRFIVWLKEMSNILISGAWDGCIKIWNIDGPSCCTTISEHYSDIYGMDISPDHPYILTSCSRDNSIRFWDISCLAKNSSKYLISNKVLNLDYPELEKQLKSANLDLITNFANIYCSYFQVKCIA